MRHIITRLTRLDRSLRADLGELHHPPRLGEAAEREHRVQHLDYRLPGDAGPRATEGTGEEHMIRLHHPEVEGCDRRDIHDCSCERGDCQAAELDEVIVPGVGRVSDHLRP